MCDRENSLPTPSGYMKGYKRQVTEVIGAPPAKVAKSAASEYAREPRTTTPASETLHAQWTKVWNDDSGQYYLCNTLTKHSSWQRPTMGPNNATELYTDALQETFGFSSEAETAADDNGWKAAETWEAWWGETGCRQAARTGWVHDSQKKLINAASESDNGKVTSAAAETHNARVVLPRYPNLCRLKQTLLHPEATAVPWPSEPTKASIKHPTGTVVVPENTASVQPSISQQQLREKKMQKPQQGPAVTVPGAGTGSSSSWCWEGWNNWSGSSWSQHWEDSGSSNSDWESHKHDSSWHWENSGDNDSTSSWHWNNIWKGDQNQNTAECAAAEANTRDVSSTAGQESSSRRSTPPKSKKKRHDAQLSTKHQPKQPSYPPPTIHQPKQPPYPPPSPRPPRKNRMRPKVTKAKTTTVSTIINNHHQQPEKPKAKEIGGCGAWISRLLHAETANTKSSDDAKCAYAVVVFGDKPKYCLEAAVLGFSLKSRTTHHLVLMHTDDVPKVWLEVCEHVGWETRRIEYLEYHKRLYPQQSRFSGTFTKLMVIGLEEFPKVLLLDTDMLVKTDAIDSIFEKPTPSACRRHATGKYMDGEEIVPDQLVKRGDQIGGINAGCVLLEPSEKGLTRMTTQLRLGQVIGNIPFTNGPEQDYLTRFYAGDSWKSLGVEWNYQLHQIAYCSRHDHETSRRMKLTYRDVNIIHFSGSTSLADWALDAEFYSRSFDEFTETVILQSYFNILEKDPKKGDKPTQIRVKKHLQKITQAATQEWFQVFEGLLVDLPTLGNLIEKERRKKSSSTQGGPKQTARGGNTKNREGVHLSSEHRSSSSKPVFPEPEQEPPM